MKFPGETPTGTGMTAPVVIVRRRVYRGARSRHPGHYGTCGKEHWHPVERKRQAVFLDRDGTLNRTEVRNGRPYAPIRLEDFRLLPGVAEAVARFRAAGYLTIVVTNQPDLATGKQSAEVLAAMHERLTAELGIDDIFVCPHTDADGCGCRKSKPGLLLAAAEKWGIDLARSVMVGDRWRDVEAGKAAGCATVYIDCGYEGERPGEGADLVVRSLPETVELFGAGPLLNL